MRAILLLVFLVGCGSSGEDENNHGYGFEFDVQGAMGLKLRCTDSPCDATTYETVFAEVQACSGLTAPAPLIVLVPQGSLGLGEFGVEIAGLYYTDPSLIVLAHLSALRHEMIHYLLDYTTGDSDGAEVSPLFRFQPDGCS